ncbi:hypothetical protein [uncultured Paracoccus sp.]|uniref:hypothetical protein n=1 Tax=uncultured Paracoccus sp. TaxID=189685 RepID=UPI00262E2397|nr:hypothetical protein [uncultured Paracoccus sp.]
MAAPGLVPRLVAGWRAPVQTVRSLRDMGESGLMALLIGTLAMYFLAQWPAHAQAARIDPSIPLGARLGGALMGTMFMMPLLVYALAGLTALVGHAAGWRGTGRDARLALIWAMAMVMPLMLLAGMVQAVSGAGGPLTAVRAAAGLAFLGFWLVNLRALGHGAPP